MSATSSIDEFLSSHPDIQITREQLACCRFLERQGKRFCIDFGYENAPQMVWAQFDDEIADKAAQIEAWEREFLS